jgi:hypothetical protein
MDNVFSASQPFLFLGEILGRFPYKYQGLAREGIFKFTLRGLICSFVTVFVIVVFFFIGRKSVEAKSSLVVDAWYLIVIMQIISHLFLWIYQLIKRESIETFLRQTFLVDNQVNIQFDWQFYMF